jgi:hypothetical protein
LDGAAGPALPDYQLKRFVAFPRSSRLADGSSRLRLTKQAQRYSVVLHPIDPIRRANDGARKSLTNSRGLGRAKLPDRAMQLEPAARVLAPREERPIFLLERLNRTAVLADASHLQLAAGAPVSVTQPAAMEPDAPEWEAVDATLAQRFAPQRVAKASAE